MDRKFGSKKEEVCKQFTILHKEKILHFYRPSNVVRIVKDKKLRWSGFVVSWKRRGIYRKFGAENCLESREGDERMILIWMTFEIVYYFPIVI
jgi:hypothetical protein